jgi:flagellar biosynthesis protein FlhF
VIIKKFQANTETEAIMLAKEELGKDAIVMNIKTISPKGFYKIFKKPLVEITAAVDDNASYKNEKPKTAPSYPVQRKNTNPDIIYDDEPDQLTFKTSAPAITEPSAIEAKLNNLQSLLEKQMLEKEKENQEKTDDKAEKNNNLAFIQLVYNQLVTNEVDEKYANQIIAEIECNLKKDASLDNILASIYQKIILKLGQPKTIELNVDQKPKFIFFIGPTGVGKTTTIAKIASKFKVNEKAKVAFLTADTYRIAAVEQLRTYANILGVPLKVIYSPEEMKQARDEFSDYDIIFVDTAGRSHRSKEQRDDVETLINTIPEEEREIYLVLSATTKYVDLIKITEAYSEIVNYNLIFTKLDETSTIGNLLNIRMLTNAPLSYATFGQNVPDDISRVDAQNIAKQLLRGQ